MADPPKEFYLRFDDPAYAGRSKYRPSEGWIDVVEHQVLSDAPKQSLRKNDPSLKGYFHIVIKDPVIAALAQVAGGQKRLADAWLSCVQVSPRGRDKSELYRWIMSDVYIGEAKPLDKQSLGFDLYCKEPKFSSLWVSRTAILIGLLVPAVQK